MKTVLKKHPGRKGLALVFALALLLAFRPAEAPIVDAADSTTLGGLENYSAVKTVCHDLQNPLKDGYCIGDSDHPTTNDVAPKNSATKWCEENGYSFGFARNMWWTGAGGCMIYPHGTSGGNAWGLSHHCFAISTIRCCY